MPQVDNRYTTSSPFPGLRPFRTDESHLFFGREGQIDEVLEKLENHRFISILGSSGSGKSSFMFCGLIPSLLGGFMSERGSNWRIVSIRPGSRPIQNLANGLLEKERYKDLSEKDLFIKREYYQAVMKASSLGLVEVLSQIKGEADENILLLIDQFEEIFRYMSRDDKSQDESSAFVNMLLNAAKTVGKPFYVVITMRSDFIGDCSVFPELTSFINESHYLIPQLSREQKKAVILGPIAVGEAQISPRLLQQLLNDLNENSDQLPILQHALMRTWAHWQTNRIGSEPIDLVHYEAIGKMNTALSLHADEAYIELSEPQQKICEIMFKALTQKGSDGRGVRRPTSVSTIAKIAAVSVDQVMEVVEQFRKPGRTFLMPPSGIELHEETYLDISHESLMRIWNRLASWVEQEAESAKIYLKLCDSAENYQAKRLSLLRPPELNLAIDWRNRENPTLEWGIRLNPFFERTMSFLSASEETYLEEQKNLNRKREAAIFRIKVFTGAVAIVALAMIFLVLYARAKEQEARSQTKFAVEQSTRADSLRLIADQQRTRAIEEQKRAEKEKLKAEEEKQRAEAEKLKAEAKEREANAERENARMQESLARSAAQIAEKETQRAKEQKELADKSAVEAEAQKVNAVAAKLDADRLRMLALSQSIAAKSEQIKDTTTQLLLARQAFNFHDQFKGAPLQPEIYSGLYGAVKKIKGNNFNHLPGHKNKVASLFYLNNALYSVSTEGKIIKRNLNTNAYDSIYNTPFSALYTVKSVAQSASGNKVAFGCSDGKIRIIDLKDRNLETTLDASKNVVWSLAFEPKKKKIAFSDSDSTQITVIDPLSQNRKVVANTQKDNKIRAFSWVNENEIAAVTTLGDLFIWDVNSKIKTEPVLRNKNEKGYALAYSPQADAIAVGFFSGKVILFNKSSAEYEEFLGHVGWVSDIAFSEDGKLMATASFDNRVQIWDLSNKSLPPLVLDDFKTWLTSICFSPDSKTLIAAAKDGTIKKFDLKIENYAEQICNHIKTQNRPSNLSQKEWNRYIGESIPIEATCK